jgi:hypothetical protein
MGMIKAELSHIKDEMKKAAMDGNSSFSIELIKPKYGDYGIGGVPSNYKVIVVDDKYYIAECKRVSLTTSRVNLALNLLKSPLEITVIATM